MKLSSVEVYPKAGHVSALTYTLLRDLPREDVTDPAFVQEALRLEQEGIVRCSPTQDEFTVCFDQEGVDAWVQTQLDQEEVTWMQVEPCVYGILNKHKEPEKFISKEKTIYRPFFETFWIQTDNALSFHAPQDTIIPFADLFCDRISLQEIIQRLLYPQKFDAVLRRGSKGLYLDEILLVQERSVLRKNLLLILMKHRGQHLDSSLYPYLTFEEIADISHKKYGIYIDDIKMKIYSPLRAINKSAEQILPKPLIEFQRGKARLCQDILCV